MNDPLNPPERDIKTLTELLQLQLDSRGTEMAELLERGFNLSPDVQARLIVALKLSGVVAAPGPVPDVDESSVKGDTVLGAIKDATRDSIQTGGVKLKERETDEQRLQTLFNENRPMIEGLANGWNQRKDLCGNALGQLAPDAEWQPGTNTLYMLAAVARDTKSSYGSAPIEVVLPSYRYTRDFGDQLAELSPFYDLQNIQPGINYRIKIESPAYQFRYSDIIIKGRLAFEAE